MYNQFFTIKPQISEKNGGSKVVHLILSKACFKFFKKYDGSPITYKNRLELNGCIVLLIILLYFPLLIPNNFHKSVFVEPISDVVKFTRKSICPALLII